MPLAVEQLGTFLDAIAADDTEANRTFTVDVEKGSFFGYSSAVTQSAASASVIDWYGSVDGGTTYGKIQSEAVSGGVATQTDFKHSNAVAADETYCSQIGCASYTHLKGIWSATSGNSGDIITLKGSLSIETR